MIKKMAWNIFKQTGNINTMMELIKAEKNSNFTEENEFQNNVIKNIRIKDDSIGLE